MVDLRQRPTTNPEEAHLHPTATQKQVSPKNSPKANRNSQTGQGRGRAHQPTQPNPPPNQGPQTGCNVSFEVRRPPSPSACPRQQRLPSRPPDTPPADATVLCVGAGLARSKLSQLCCGKWLAGSAAPVAEWVRRLPLKVAGSSPASGNKTHLNFESVLLFANECSNPRTCAQWDLLSTPFLDNPNSAWDAFNATSCVLWLVDALCRFVLVGKCD